MLLLFFTLLKCSVLEFPKNYVYSVFVSNLNFIEEFIGEAKEVFMSQKKQSFYITEGRHQHLKNNFLQLWSSLVPKLPQLLSILRDPHLLSFLSFPYFVKENQPISYNKNPCMASYRATALLL